MRDVELLEKHRSGSEQAFAELVRRHLGWVYGVARRNVRDEHLAEDVAQAVFVLLHRKAPRFAADGAMIRWMHRTAGYASKVAMRNQNRRAKHEAHAAMLRPATTEHLDANHWLQLAPLLDGLIEKLNRSDREAILLRYFRDLSFAEVAVETGTTADAARKRVERAVTKLRLFAAKKGLALSEATLAIDLGQNIRIQAPPDVITANPGLAGSSATIVKGTILMMNCSKAIVVGTALISTLVLGGTIWAVLPTPPPAASKTVIDVPSKGRCALAPAFRWRLPTDSLPTDGSARIAGAVVRTANATEMPQIQIDGVWYDLLKLRDRPILDIVSFAKSRFDSRWQQRIQEDLPQILTDMKLADGPMKLELRRLDTGQIVTIPDAPMTADNRRLIMFGSLDGLSGATHTLFSALRWDKDIAQVQVNGNDTWYVLVAVGTKPAKDFLEFAQKNFGSHWEENSVDVFDAMTGKPHSFDDVWLHLRTLDSNTDVTILKRVFPPTGQDAKEPEKKGPPAPTAGTTGL